MDATDSLGSSGRRLLDARHAHSCRQCRTSSHPRNEARPFSDFHSRSAAFTKNGLFSSSSFGFGVLEVQAWGQQTVLEGEGSLDQSRSAGGRIEMADVALHRPQRAELLSLRSAPECLGKRSDFNRIANRCGSAVSFDVGNRIRFDAGNLLRQRNHLGLTFDARRSEADPLRSVVVKRAALNYGVRSGRRRPALPTVVSGRPWSHRC